MNKIKLEDDVRNIEDEKLDLKYSLSNLTLNIKGEVIINDYDNNQDIFLKINLLDDAKLIYNRFNTDTKDIKIEINCNNNNSLIFNEAIKQDNNNGNINAYINIIGNNNNIVTNIYGLTDKNGSLKIMATGSVVKDIKDNEVLENVRILMLNDVENIIIPNLLVSSDMVVVEHNATISSVSNDYLFYLKSKGINERKATKLIANGFLYSKLK